MNNHKNKIKNLPPTAIYIDRDKLSFCDIKTSSLLVFNYPPSTVKDLEIINHDELSKQLLTFIEQHQIAPTDLIFILSPNVAFEKDLSHLSEDERQNQTHIFLDVIPFSSVSSRLFHIGTDYKLVAINRDLYESIKTAFEFAGFSVTAVVPNFVLGSIGVKDGFNFEACRVIVKRPDFITENSFLTKDEDQTLVIKQRHFLQEHSTLFALLSLSFVAFAAITAVITLRQPTPKPHTNLILTGRPSITPIQEPTATPIPQATSSAQFTIQVANGSGVVGLAGQVEKELTTLGFTNIKTGNAPVSSQRTLVVYSSRVPQSIRDQINTVLGKTFAELSPQEVSDAEFDISITTGKVSPK